MRRPLKAPSWLRRLYTDRCSISFLGCYSPAVHRWWRCWSCQLDHLRTGRARPNPCVLFHPLSSSSPHPNLILRSQPPSPRSLASLRSPNPTQHDSQALRWSARLHLQNLLVPRSQRPLQRPRRDDPPRRTRVRQLLLRVRGAHAAALERDGVEEGGGQFGLGCRLWGGCRVCSLGYVRHHFLSLSLSPIIRPSTDQVRRRLLFQHLPGRRFVF